MDSRKILGPAAEYKHEEHVIKNINLEFQEKQTYSQRIADWLANMVGSWSFIIYQSAIILVWVGVNGYMAFTAANHGSLQPWDPYPYILLNLVLGIQAAYTGPVVMMSQNRQGEKDRLMMEHDYQINQKAEEEIKVLMNHLVHQDAIMAEILTQLEKTAQNPPE